MQDARTWLYEWLRAGRLAPERLPDALAAAGLVPDRAAWRAFADRALAWSGAAALALAVLFGVAYNWEDLPRLARFALVESALVAALIVHWRAPEGGVLDEATLFAAALLLGTLLALAGQTYQTGADPWQLFATWSVLLVPWAVLGRSAPLWLLWLAVTNLAVHLYFATWHGAFAWLASDLAGLWALTLLDLAALAVWEWRAAPRRWGAGLLAATCTVLLSALALSALLGSSDALDGATLVAYAVLLTAGYVFYRHRRLDLRILAGGCLSLIVVGAVKLFELSDHRDGAATYLLIAALVLAASIAAVRWLRGIDAGQGT